MRLPPSLQSGQDAEARLGLLRARADSGLVNNASHNADVELQERLSGHSGHINLFADLEQVCSAFDSRRELLVETTKF